MLHPDSTAYHIFKFFAYMVMFGLIGELHRRYKERKVQPVSAPPALVDRPTPEADCWAVLGIESTYDERIIKKAYRRLMKEHHPDIAGENEKSRQINEAYEQAIKESSMM